VKKIRVLIVDDSLFMRAAIAKTLATGPFEVVGQAKDGKSALVEIAKLSPDVVTMDFNMPGLNGAETVRELMKTKPTPVVMFSAHTKQGAKETFDALADVARFRPLESLTLKGIAQPVTEYVVESIDAPIEETT